MARSRASEGKTKANLLKNVDLSSILTPAKPAPHIAGTKALVTLGPASREVDVLVKLLEAGTSCCRVDLTYGSVEYHSQSLRNLQAAVRETRRLCAVVLDTFGRELVIRREYEVDEKGWPKPKNREIEISKGQEVIVTTDPEAVAHDNVLPIEQSDFDKVCKKGDTLFVGRYLTNGADVSSIYLDVTKVEEGKVTCRAQNDAVLDGLITVIHSEAASDGMSYFQANLPLLTTRDRRAIASLTKEFEIDFIALTYTCHGDDVTELRDYLDSLGQDGVKIIAKVESRQALINFESIALEADAVLLSRGNLGLDVPPEKVALVQKSAIKKCNVLGKPVIITRVVDTMTSAPRCTRAEATDVANAVLDGVDGILLGAETLRGKYPVESVVTVLGICRQAEQVFNYKSQFDFLMEQAMEDQEEDQKSGSASPQGESLIFAQSSDDPGKPLSLALGGKPPKNPSSLVGKPSTPLSRKSTGGLSHRASSFGSIPKAPSGGSLNNAGGSGTWTYSPSMMSRAESMASTAVRAADKIQAKLIVVYAATGRTASLVAKYRPPMPILTLVVPNLKSTALSWQMQGRSLARQLLCMRGVIPLTVRSNTARAVGQSYQAEPLIENLKTLIETDEEGVIPILAAPGVDGSSDGMLAEAIAAAARKGLVGPSDHVVCLLSVKDLLVLKIVSIDELGGGKVSARKGSHNDLAGLLSTRSAGMSSAPSGELSTGVYQQIEASRGAIAEPNIGITAPSQSPAESLVAGAQSKTKEN